MCPAHTGGLPGPPHTRLQETPPEFLALLGEPPAFKGAPKPVPYKAPGSEVAEAQQQEAAAAAVGGGDAGPDAMQDDGAEQPAQHQNGGTAADGDAEMQEQEDRKSVV